MTIVADRGLFVRLLVQSGKFDAPAAEALVDAIDASVRDPATKVDLAELQGEVALQGQRLDDKIDAVEARLGARMDRLEIKLDALQNQLLLKLGGLMIALFGATLAAMRLMLP